MSVPNPITSPEVLEPYMLATIAVIKHRLTTARQSSNLQNEPADIQKDLQNAAMEAAGDGKPYECGAIILLLAQIKSCALLMEDFNIFFGQNHPPDFGQRLDGEIGLALLYQMGGKKWSWGENSVYQEYISNRARQAESAGALGNQGESTSA